jgi:hypothetical protein
MDIIIHMSGSTPPYRITETRTGPPLSYVSEKIRGALTNLHGLYSQIQRDLPDGLPCPEAFLTIYPQYDPKNELQFTCRWAFCDAVIAYLALNNFLGRVEEQGLVERLLAMPNAEFHAWLHYIHNEGLPVNEPPKPRPDLPIPED